MTSLPPPSGALPPPPTSTALVPTEHPSGPVADAPPVVVGDSGPEARGDTPRLVGPDVVRAVGLIGVAIMNYHGYLIHRGGERSDNTWGSFFDPWTGPLSTRFAAVFVLASGVGVTLMTRRSMHDPELRSAKRWILIRRGVVLYAFGVLFDQIWPGTILSYYGAMFFLAAFIFVLPSLAIAAVGVAAAAAGALIQWWAVEQRADGQSVNWLLNPGNNSPRGLLFDVFVNGTHPLLPWLAFFCAGILIGRALRTEWWRPVALTVGATLFGFATLLSDSLTSADSSPTDRVLWSNDPFDRGILYTASNLGTALAAFTIVYTLAMWFPRSWLVRGLGHAGQMSLTVYIAHALVFNLLVDWLGWIEPSGLDLALTFALGYWAVAIVAASVWHQLFGIGPAEWVYRRLGG